LGRFFTNFAISRAIRWFSCTSDVITKTPFGLYFEERIFVTESHYFETLFSIKNENGPKTTVTVKLYFGDSGKLCFSLDIVVFPKIYLLVKNNEASLSIGKNLKL
jgi:hypothetical protein